MPRKLIWHLSLEDLYDLFEATFGPHYDTEIVYADFDPDIGVLIVELEDEFSDKVTPGVYSGVKVS